MDKNLKRISNELLQLYRFPILKRDNWKCLVCSSEDYLEVDHKISLNNGGQTNAENLQTLCSRCNSIKSKDNYNFIKTNQKDINNNIDRKISENLRKRNNRKKNYDPKLVLSLIPYDLIRITDLYTILKDKGILFSYRTLQRYITSMGIAELILIKQINNERGKRTYVKRI